MVGGCHEGLFCVQRTVDVSACDLLSEGKRASERKTEEKDGCRWSFPGYLALLAGASFWAGSVLVLHLGSSANHCPGVCAFPFCVPKDP